MNKRESVLEVARAMLLQAADAVRLDQDWVLEESEDAVKIATKLALAHVAAVAYCNGAGAVLVGVSRVPENLENDEAYWAKAFPPHASMQMAGHFAKISMQDSIEMLPPDSASRAVIGAVAAQVDKALFQVAMVGRAMGCAIEQELGATAREACRESFGVKTLTVPGEATE